MIKSSKALALLGAGGAAKGRKDGDDVGSASAAGTAQDQAGSNLQQSRPAGHTICLLVVWDGGGWKQPRFDASLVDILPFSIAAHFSEASINVELTGARTVDTGVKKSFVEYIIRVTVVQSRTLREITTWVVSHRYSDFETLDTSVLVHALRVCVCVCVCVCFKVCSRVMAHCSSFAFFASCSSKAHSRQKLLPHFRLCLARVCCDAHRRESTRSRSGEVIYKCICKSCCCMVQHAIATR
jgi:hypothetical protein